MDYKYMWQDFVTCVRGATNGTFIHSFMYLFPYIHLQVQPKDVQTVTIQYTICLFKYRCHYKIQL